MDYNHILVAEDDKEILEACATSARTSPRCWPHPEMRPSHEHSLTPPIPPAIMYSSKESGEKPERARRRKARKPSAPTRGRTRGHAIGVT